jgi:quinol monooxygenase YgiN
VVYARFKDQAAFDFHQEADFHQRLVPLILDRVEGEMDLQFFEWVS